MNSHGCRLSYGALKKGQSDPPTPPATVLQTLIFNDLGCNKGATIWLFCCTCSTLTSHPPRPHMAMGGVEARIQTALAGSRESPPANLCSTKNSSEPCVLCVLSGQFPVVVAQSHARFICVDVWL